MTRARSAWTAGLLLALFAAAGPQSGAEPPARREVRIGMIRSMFRDIPEAMLAPLSKPFQSLIYQQTGYSGELDLSPDAATLARRIEDGTVQLGVFHGFEYAWMQETHPELKPLVIAVPTCDKFQACLVVRDDCPCRGWGDFRGRRIALPRGSREHCRLFLERNRRRAAAEVCEITCPPSVEDALDDVVDGLADATVVDDGAVLSFSRRKPGRFARLKVVCQSEVFPPSVVVYRSGGLEPHAIERFRDGLIRAHHTAQGKRMMMLWRLSGFAPVPPDYPVQLAAIRKAYPPPTDTETDPAGQ